MNKGFGIGVEAIEAVLRADPEDTGAIFKNRPDDIITQAGRIVGIMLVACELPAIPIQFVELIILAKYSG